MSTIPCNTIPQDMTANCNCGTSECTCVQQNCDPCSSTQGCPVNLDTSCVFYNLTSSSPSGLGCLDLPNGTNVTTILEAMSAKLCQIAPDFSTFDLPCLSSQGYIINTLAGFVEAVDYQLCMLKGSIQVSQTTLQQQMANITAMIAAINTPNITSCSQLPILPTDSLVTILQKYSDAFCDIYTNCCADNSPVITPINTNSISFIASGVKNHTFLANVNISGDAGNLIEIRPNGLYASLTIPDQLQNLVYNPLTNELTISEGNSVELGSAPAPQTLSVDCVGKTITISGGNTIDVSCLAGSSSPETPIVGVDTATLDIVTSGTSGHILSGNVKISATAGNAISANPDGLYSQNNKVSINSGDTVPGFLSDKVTGVAGAILTVVTTPNTTTNKVEISATLDLSAMLTVIAADPLLISQFCDMVTNCSPQCYSFRVTNTGAGENYVDYVDCNNASVRVPLPAGSIITFCAKSVTPSSNEVTVEFLGNC